ncbi:hypothetical protein KOR34_15700 [Posidoniimonas corsicana]|uniref:Uncharacterized protein n=1 Tax=Posidoniimonas corsicana TaxID=1938618 RepID=A0A5C5VEQ4_9BACT|nr:DUF1580 domain-containing protein [Posidoniimonas corsicana]TWT36631.1 hypothetical protein KOR34_15700 [Posidoniimonas corsicana]
MPKEPSRDARWSLEKRVHEEILIALPDVPEWLPSRRGRKVHKSTIYRWVQRGVRGKVLESYEIGGVRYTSVEALQRFMGTGPADPMEHRRSAVLRNALAARGLLGRDANKRQS